MKEPPIIEDLKILRIRNGENTTLNLEALWGMVEANRPLISQKENKYVIDMQQNKW